MNSGGEIDLPQMTLEVAVRSTLQENVSSTHLNGRGTKAPLLPPGFSEPLHDLAVPSHPLIFLAFLG